MEHERSGIRHGLEFRNQGRIVPQRHQHHRFGIALHALRELANDGHAFDAGDRIGNEKTADVGIFEQGAGHGNIGARRRARGGVQRIAGRAENRQGRAQLLHGCRCQLGKLKADVLREIVDQRHKRARGGQNRGPLGGRIRVAREQFADVHDFIHGVHHQYAGVGHVGEHRAMVADQRTGMGCGRRARLGATARMQQDHRLFRRACSLAGRHEFPGPPDLFRVQHDGAGVLVLDHEFGEIGKIETGFVAGGNDVGDGHAARLGGALHVTDHAAALTDESHAGLGAGLPAFRRLREQHVQREAADIVGIPQAVGADDGQPAIARGARHFGLNVMLAGLGETRGENQRGPHLALHAVRHRVLHAGCGQSEYRQVDALGQIKWTRQQFAPVDGFRVPAYQVDIALEIVGLQAIENILAGRAGARGHADDGD